MAPAHRARSSLSLRRLVKVRGMNTVLARRPRRKDQVDRKSRRHLAAAVMVPVVAAMALVAVAAVVDDLNPPRKCNELRSALSAEFIFVVQSCYLPLPFLIGSPARLHRLIPPLKFRTVKPALVKWRVAELLRLPDAHTQMIVRSLGNSLIRLES